MSQTKSVQEKEELSTLGVEPAPSASGAIAISNDAVETARRGRKGDVAAVIDHPEPQVLGIAAAQAAGAVNHRVVIPEVPAAALARLSRDDQRAIEEMRDGHFSAETRRNFRDLVNSETFRNAGTDVQAGLMRTMIALQSQELSQAQLLSIVTPGTRLNSQFTSLSSAQQGQLLDVFEQTNLSGRNYLLQLLEMPRPAGQPQEHGRVPSHALLSRDSTGHTLLDNLHSLATGPLNPALQQNGVERHVLLQGVLQETANPGEVNQSSRGTCAVTAMQWMLCMREPAEYARIMAGLTSPEGSVRLRNGDTMTLRTTTLLSDETNRTPSERFFQASMMEYSIGNGMIYSNLTDSRHSGFMGAMYEGVAMVRRAFGASTTHETGSGLFRDESARGMSALFGTPHVVDNGQRGFWSNVWGAIREVFNGNPQNAMNHFNPAYHVVETLRNNPGPHWVGMRFGAPDENGRIHEGHAVAVTEIRDGRVYYRNPWGRSGDANGTEYNDPPRRMEDRTIGLESMTIEQFMALSPATIQPVGYRRH